MELTLDLDHLDLFVQIAEAGSLSRVAKASATPQSIVSRRLAQLEAEWGDRLFERTGRGVALSEFGQSMLPQVRLVLDQARRLKEHVTDFAGVPRGEVHLGILPSMTDTLIPALYTAVAARAPHIRLHIREGFSGQLDDLLAQGRLDLAIINRYGPHAPSGEEVLGQAETLLVGRPGHPLLERETIAFRKLDKVPLALPNAPNGLTLLLDQFATRLGVEINCRLYLDTIQAMKTIARHSSVLTVLPRVAIANEIAEGQLVASRIVEPDMQRTISLATTRQHPLSRAGRTILSLAKEATRDILNASGGR